MNGGGAMGDEDDVVGAGGNMERDEEPLDGDDPAAADEEAETLQMNGVAAARNRRLKSQKAEEASRGTPGNAASSS
jgi:hypothetical protein